MIGSLGVTKRLTHLSALLVFFFLHSSVLMAQSSLKHFSDKGPFKPIIKTTDKNPKELLDRSIEQFGGLDKFKSLKTIYIKSSYDGQQQSLTIESFVKLPDQTRMDYFDLAGNKLQSIILNGPKAFQIANDTRTEFTPEQTKYLTSLFKVDTLDYLIATDGVKYELSYLGESEINGKKVDVVEIKAVDVPTTRYLFDVTTHKLLAYHAQYGEQEVSVIKSDFRKQDGMEFAFKMITYIDMDKSTSMTTEMKINPQLNDALFQ